MLLSRKWILALVIVSLGIANILTLLKVSLFGVTGLLWLFNLCLLGRMLINPIVKSSRIKVLEKTLYSVGLAVLAVYLIGVILNTYGVLFHVSTLKLRYVLPALDLVFILTTAIAGRSTFTDITISIKKKWLIVMLPFSLPLFALLGAVQLNNGGPGVVALITLIAAVMLAIIAVRSKTYASNEALLVTTIFAISLSLVLSVTMRSQHLIGYDIFGEYKEFSQTFTHGSWSFTALDSTYAGCLSITILPTILAVLIPVALEFIFKFYMQFILCLLPLVVYVVARRVFTQKKVQAFIAALLFIAPGQFIYQFPALVRQQAALLFFGLIFLAFTNRLLSYKARFALMVLFGLGMVTSHYSTTYVCIAFLVIYWIAQMISKVVIANLQKPIIVKVPRLEVTYIILVTLFAFFWYGQFFQNSGGIEQKLQSSLSNLTSAFSGDNKSPFINSLLGNSNKYTDTDLSQIEKATSLKGSIASGTEDGTVTTAQPKGIIVDSSLKSIAFSIIHRYLPLIANIFVMIGLVIAFFASWTKKRISFLTYAVPAGLSLMLLIIILPELSKDYNFERLYQQFLLFFAPALYYALTKLTKIFSPKDRLISLCAVVVAVLTLLCASGAADQLVFRSSNVNLSNSGANYDHFYVSQGELLSAKWLNSNTSGAINVNVDNYSQLILRTYTQIPYNEMTKSVFPSTVRNNSYIYASDYNLDQGVADQLYNGVVYPFTFPRIFDDNHKNVVYTNNKSRIYR